MIVIRILWDFMIVIRILWYLVIVYDSHQVSVGSYIIRVLQMSLGLMIS